MKTLQDHVAKLEAQYDILNEELARGENAGFSAESESQVNQLMTICTSSKKRLEIPQLYPIKISNTRIKERIASHVGDFVLITCETMTVDDPVTRCCMILPTPSWWNAAHQKMNAATFVPKTQKNWLFLSLKFHLILS